MIHVLRSLRQRSLAREHHATGDQHQRPAIATVLPGITLNTSPTDYRPIKKLRLIRWSGKKWERFGDMIEGANA